MPPSKKHTIPVLEDKPRSIKQVPVANERLNQEVALLTKQDKKEVRDMIEFVGKFISTTIKRGDMEGVMIPYFGKFRPKVKQLRAMKMAQALRANGMAAVFKAVRGKIVVIDYDKLKEK